MIKVNIIKFHKDNKYCIIINKLKDGLAAFFPPNYLLQPVVLDKNYIYKKCPEGFAIYSEDQRKVFEIDSYAYRYAIFADILLKTLERKMPGQLILVSDKKKKVTSLVSILPSLTTEEDRQKEKRVEQAFHEIFTKMYDVDSATKLGIRSGYEKLNELVEMGGLVI